jgi:hypothetical protein
MPAAMRAAKELFPKASRRRLRAVADTIDHHTDLPGTIRFCAIILRDIDRHTNERKPLWLWLAKYALRDVILGAGHRLEDLEKIINPR